MMKTDYLFSLTSDRRMLSGLLLGLRLSFGILLFLHGWDKLMNFHSMADTFPDPLGWGSQVSLMLVVLTECVCSLAFIAGYFFRWALLPMIFTMGVAFFSAHGARIPEGELALLYFLVFSMLLLTGPGHFSVEAMLYRYKHRDLYEERKAL